MKKLILAAFAAALLLPGAGALSARAQDDGPGSEHGGPPPEMGEKMADKMKEKLGLSDEQSAKIKDAMKAHQEAMKPSREKMKELMKKLHEQVKAKAADGDLTATLTALKDQRKEMTAAQEKFHETMAALLTPTQQAKFVLGAAKQMRKRMEGMRDRRDGKGGKDK